MNPLDQIMDTAEAAERWGVTQDYVKMLCRQGKVVCRKIARSYILMKDQPNPVKKSNQK